MVDFFNIIVATIRTVQLNNIFQATIARMSSATAIRRNLI